MEENKNVNPENNGQTQQNPPNQQAQQNNDDLKTIMPSLIDFEEFDKNNKQVDLSAIIPDFEVQESQDNSIALESKDKELKSDGSIILGRFENEEVVLAEKIEIPFQIDPVKRKEEIEKNKNVKKRANDKKRKVKKNLKKNNSGTGITLIIVFVCLAFIGAFAYYYKNYVANGGFQVLRVVVELGDALPYKKEEYIKTSLGKSIDDLEYQINTSEVIVDQVGEYKYTVTHDTFTKTGTIIIQDTTKPELKLREVTISEGTSYSPENFVSECNEYTRVCNYAFDGNENQGSYTEPGIYDIRISATDQYNNKTVEKTTLTIESKGNIKKYSKSFDEKDYKMNIVYELHYSENNNGLVLNFGSKITTYEFEDEDKFKEMAEEHHGESEYEFDEKKQIIIQKEKIQNVNDYIFSEEINEYLISEGYKEE